jgi:rhodanese-related sulfurtransferase
MKTISPAELNELLATQPNLALLDVRTPVEFAEVHIPQARNIPLDELQPKRLLESGQLRRDQPVYLLCRTGTRACKAADKLAKENLDCIIVEGGTVAWTQHGLPVSRSAVKVISLERQVRIVAGSLVVIGAVLAWQVHPAFIALCAFVGAGLVFAGVTDFCGMGLLLAKMPWNKRAAASPCSDRN